MRHVRIKPKCEISSNVRYCLDQQRFQQVLLNLLDNAIKFSHKRSKISIKAEVEKNHEDKELIKVSVSDQGIGIKEADIAQLFRPFFRIKNEASDKLNPTGNGLGLYMCKQICTKAGGYITVSPILMGGMKFTYTMAITPASQQ